MSSPVSTEERLKESRCDNVKIVDDLFKAHNLHTTPTTTTPTTLPSPHPPSQPVVASHESNSLSSSSASNTETETRSPNDTSRGDGCSLETSTAGAKSEQNPTTNTEDEYHNHHLSNSGSVGADVLKDIPADVFAPSDAHQHKQEEEVNYDCEQEEDSNENEKEKKEDEFVLAEIDEETLRTEDEKLTPLQLDERAIKALDLKEEANGLYKESRMEEALQLYTEALTVCPVDRKKQRAALYGNRSAVCFHLQQHKTVVRECTKALEYDADYMKVLKRRAKSHEKLDQLEQALEDYKRVLERDPGDHEARERVMHLPQEINERNERLKTEMMGKLKDLGNMFLKPFGLSTNNFQFQQDPNTGGYNVQFSQNPTPPS